AVRPRAVRRRAAVGLPARRAAGPARDAGRAGRCPRRARAPARDDGARRGRGRAVAGRPGGGRSGAGARRLRPLPGRPAALLRGAGTRQLGGAGDGAPLSAHGDERTRAGAVTCPKHMVYGPCAGVTADGGCEVDAALTCPFVDAPTVRWGGPDPTATPPARAASSRPGAPGAA